MAIFRKNIREFVRKIGNEIRAGKVQINELNRTFYLTKDKDIWFYFLGQRSVPMLHLKELVDLNRREEKYIRSCALEAGLELQPKSTIQLKMEEIERW